MMKLYTKYYLKVQQRTIWGRGELSQYFSGNFGILGSTYFPTAQVLVPWK